MSQSYSVSGSSNEALSLSVLQQLAFSALRFSLVL